MTTILIIDDEKLTREELARIVEEGGWRAITAENGLEGLRLTREQHPALVLVDVEMAGFDGYKTAAAIKLEAAFTPVMLLTARTDVETKRRGQSAGADDFLSKPVVPLELHIRIAAMLRIKLLTDQLDQANRRLAEIADTDGLTSIANRRRFDQLLSLEHERALRYRRPLAVAIADIDFFKRINDTYGHAVGDEALKAVARALAESLRRSDHCARLGGEEFALLAPEIGAAGALALGERLRKRVEAIEEPVQLSISIGVVAWDGLDPIPPAQLLEQADRALYQAKQAGRNRVALAVAKP